MLVVGGGNGRVAGGRWPHSSRSAQRATRVVLVPESCWMLWRRCTCAGVYSFSV